ncbi:hypothetical protein U6A24_13850 [Aquimarina gracilis]|uniref:Leucine rich repeat (LRR) protein n=1 Tax=Aquimarina gracilis TaxID=874422 RepID=A0ABU5ZXG4_9FLAO|nr:hypothetical protein [Aquimarina gracilis]MEB3346557.1 hypothetical protein [Aquimarina gracilis]
MIKKKAIYLLLVIIAVFANSCATYTNFYSKTHISVPQNDTSIHRLDLSDQGLDSLPNSVSKLKDLRMINLSKNPKLDLEKVIPKLVSHKNLEILILDSLNISKLPYTIRKLSNLKQLSLAYNANLDTENTLTKIAELPIEFLNLKGNHIKTLPKNITKLESLKDFNLSHNRLKGNQNYELLGLLPNLYSLWIDHNQLTELPNSIGKINQIRFLYIDHNDLQELPEAMSTMKTWVVHAGYNKFKELPGVFTKMPALFMVHMNNNDITTIPKVYETESYPLAGLILDNNPVLKPEKQKAKQLFKGFFLLSFEQK